MIMRVSLSRRKIASALTKEVYIKHLDGAIKPFLLTNHWRPIYVPFHLIVLHNTSDKIKIFPKRWEFDDWWVNYLYDMIG